MIRRQHAYLLCSIIGTFVLPIALYWLLYSSVPHISVDDAKAILSQPASSTLLIDVRPADAYAKNHLDKAINWPLSEISSLTEAKMLPDEFQRKRLLLICNSGLDSSTATRRLRNLGLAETYSISGGLAEWNTISGGKCSVSNLRNMAFFEQWLAIISASLFKPFYMTLALVLGIWLWRKRGADLAALRRGLLVFWLGESACATNYFFFDGRSDLWEYMHSYGMVLSFSFFTYALVEGLDRRLIKYSLPEERCGALNICRECIKYVDVPCGIKRIYLFLIPTLIILAFLPFCVPLHVISYNATILNSVQNYTELISSQLFESRYCSVLAVLMFSAAWLVLRFNQKNGIYWSKIFFATAMGPLSFGLMRVFLLGLFNEDLVWFIAWEEITELLFVLFIAFFLWQFRKSLFAK